MPKVEVFDGEGEDPAIFVGEFDFLPRPGDVVSKDAGGYFRYYEVVEVWHREQDQTGVFQACIRVQLDD